jgi:tRNA uridine 5-carboxymethylaminomethyl modification enzyme
MYSVIIVGGGHAGVEASILASKICGLEGKKVALVTLREDNLGMMSCNPAIGGIGKGVIVREIDALGGIMAKAIDKASIHSKMLNQSKGEAVWGPRAQADRELYKKSVSELIKEQKFLDVIVDSAEELIVEENEVKGLKLKGGRILNAKAVVVTTGTFLSGLILIGEKRIKAGRVDEEPSYGLSTSLKSLKLEMGRLKTGTPARLLKESINWSILEKQEGDNPPTPFSYLTKEIKTPQIFCGITYTNKTGHDLMLANAEKSPIYTKEITAKGPRYCPSIEDKITRFSSKEEHRVFLEPEGLNSPLIYPNGLSTAMSEDVQLAFLKTIKGLENVEVAKYGYAIEYDFVNPQELKATLETKKCKGLFLAGQINGTTGYEEAGGQGVIAGINAGLLATGSSKEFTVDRSEGYIGVMIDDLITKGVIEPYRMFTSRSEYRLSIRADNADIRLTQKIIDLKIAEDERKNQLNAKLEGIKHYMQVLKSRSFTSSELNKVGIMVSQDGIKRNGFEMLCHQLISYNDVEKMFNGELANIPEDVKQQILISAKYNFYLKQQEEDIEAFKKDENLKIPPDFNFRSLKTLSTEVIEKFETHKPQNIGQALRIQGITPASVISIIIALK